MTTQQAAEALGVTERTIRRMCEERKLGSRVQREKGRKPFRMVNSDDVDRVLGDRVNPMLTKAEPGKSRDCYQAFAIEAPRPSVPERTFEDGARLMAALLKARELPPVVKPWLTLDEAAEYSGLPKSYLLAQARGRDAGFAILREPCVMVINVGTEKRASWRFNRAALAR